MSLYYVFDDEQASVDAEGVICLIAGAPLVSRNAKTGELEPDKQKTERWAIPQQRIDGKWVFPKVPDELLAQYPQEVLDNFNTSYPYVFEEYDVSWFPVEDDI